ncbi:FT-interacting protein 1-like [Canna indica]|uniref:FT-interacting protein 1-like n=1 Tax=Canna indica TaxID=4628 RepID=A0AAQ3KH20_9LILI|nr:FT-interacting protein 1-like [Canna indica]
MPRGLQASHVEVVLKDKDLVKDDFAGLVRLDINEIPTRVPPDSPLAPDRVVQARGQEQREA